MKKHRNRIRHGVYRHIKMGNKQFHQDWLSQNRPLPHYPIRTRKRNLFKAEIKRIKIENRGGIING